MTSNPFPMDIHEIANAVEKGELSAVDVAKRAIDNTTRNDKDIGAFIFIDAEGALAQAHAVDEKRKRGERVGALAGVPIALKDNICTRGAPTTCASKILQNYVPPYSAHVVEQLRKADAVLIGKTNMDEFAMGSSTENSAFKKTHNPWKRGYAPGGSSGGSAAAVAAGFAAGSLGSDTGGSVRQPGAFCGLSALKPTYGRISRYGVIAFASSFDQIGTFARSVRGSARLLGVLAGHDRRDATSARVEPEPYEQALQNKASVKGKRIGVVRQSDGVDESVLSATDEALRWLKDAGAEITEVRLPHASFALAAYYVLAPAEASSNLARFDGVRYGYRHTAEDLEGLYRQTRGEGFGREVCRRIMIGTYALSAGYYDALYGQAQRVRTLICRDYSEAFKRCDAVLTPTTPTPAFKLGEKVSNPVQMYLADIFTLPPSLAGLPAINCPVSVTQDGLPIGVQLCAPAFQESAMLTMALAIEERSTLRHQMPIRDTKEAA